MEYLEDGNTITERRVTGTTDIQKVFENLTVSRNYTLRVIAKNTYGESTFTSSEIATHVPSLGEVKLEYTNTSTSTNVKLNGSWSLANYGGDANTIYNIELYNSSTTSVDSSQNDLADTNYVFENLTAGNNYNLKVTAVNNAGISIRNSNYIIAKSPPTIDSVSLTQNESREFVAKWKLDSNGGETNLNNINYTITLYQKNGSDFSQVGSPVNKYHNGTETVEQEHNYGNSFTVGNVYKIEVSVWNNSIMLASDDRNSLESELATFLGNAQTQNLSISEKNYDDNGVNYNSILASWNFDLGGDSVTNIQYMVDISVDDGYGSTNSFTLLNYDDDKSIDVTNTNGNYEYHIKQNTHMFNSDGIESDLDYTSGYGNNEYKVIIYVKNSIGIEDSLESSGLVVSSPTVSGTTGPGPDSAI